MRIRAFNAILALVLMTAATMPALPQADVSSATIKGTVTDPNGAVVAGATITAKNSDKGITRTVKTDRDGIYQIPLLQPGSYELRIEATGFGTSVVNKAELTVGQIGVFDVQLRLGSVTTEVVVTGDAPLIEVERTQQANTINSVQIENLPNIGRGFTAYVFTLPGVSSSDAPRVQNPGYTFGSSGFSIGGSNGRNNLITVDGGENEYGSGQLRNPAISVEAIQEFQVNRNAFAAEFGFTAGTAVNVVTKSGTNNWHGSGYIFYRNQHTSARNFFDFHKEKAFDQRVFPGGTFGGPIKKNKAFFFTSFESLKADTSRLRSYTDNPAVLGPTAAQAAYLAPLDASTNANLRRIAGNLRAALTTTNYASTMSLLRANEGAINAPDRIQSWTSRLDYQIGSADSLTGRFSLLHSNTDNLLEANTGSPSASTVLYSRDYTAVATWTHTFGANLINQLRGQIVPNNSARTVPKAPGSTSLLISGIGDFGRGFATPFNTFQDRYQLEDYLSLNKGRHNMKFGASFRAVNYKVINELWFAGEWQFASNVFPGILAVPAADRAALAAAGASTIPTLSSIQAFDLGLPFLYRQGFGNAEWKDLATYLGAFAQDSWKISSRLTIDAGVRYDYDGEPKPLKHNGYFSPRLGFAWDPKGDQKTVIRGGGGVFYSPVYYQVAYVTNLLNDSGNFISQIFKTPNDGAAAPAVLWAQGLALGKLPTTALSETDLNRFGVATAPHSAGRVVFDADPNYKNNYSIQASLGISRKLWRDISLDLAYQMYRGVHIQMDQEVNYRQRTDVPVDPSFGPQFARIDPAIAQNNIYKAIGNSIYHGATLSLTKRFSHNFQFQANYTFSKAIDDNTDFNSAFAAFIPTRLDLERALSAYDIRNNFVFNGVWRTPWKAGQGSNLLQRAFADISISPIFYGRSGIPFTVRFGRDVNGDAHSLYDRPFRASRNSGHGAKFFSGDLRVDKQFYVNRDSGFRVEFIAEAQNVFNHANFLAVNDVFATDPGVYNLTGVKGLARTSPLGFTAAGPPRQIQFALKLVF